MAIKMYDIRRIKIPSERNLSRHNSLSFDDQQAIGALTLFPSTEFLVTFETRDDSVIATSCAFRRAEQSLLVGVHLLEIATQSVHDCHRRSSEELNLFLEHPAGFFFPGKENQEEGSLLTGNSRRLSI